jgi:hypothetical protein
MTWEPKRYKSQEFMPLIKFLVDMYQPDTYVEVGIQKGHCFKQIAPLVKTAIGIDIKLLFDIPGSILIEKPSLEVARNWNHGLIDLLFIDGDHKFESVLADIDAFLPYVRPQTGLILLHDTYPGTKELAVDGYCSDAWRAARDIHCNNKYSFIEIITLPGPYAGLSILRKAGKHLHWR